MTSSLRSRQGRPRSVRMSRSALACSAAGPVMDGSGVTTRRSTRPRREISTEVSTRRSSGSRRRSRLAARLSRSSRRRSLRAPTRNVSSLIGWRRANSHDTKQISPTTAAATAASIAGPSRNEPAIRSARRATVSGSTSGSHPKLMLNHWAAMTTTLAHAANPQRRAIVRNHMGNGRLRSRSTSGGTIGYSTRDTSRRSSSNCMSSISMLTSLTIRPVWVSTVAITFSRYFLSEGRDRVAVLDEDHDVDRSFLLADFDVDALGERLLAGLHPAEQTPERCSHAGNSYDLAASVTGKLGDDGVRHGRDALVGEKGEATVDHGVGRSGGTGFSSGCHGSSW